MRNGEASKERRDLFMTVSSSSDQTRNVSYDRMAIGLGSSMIFVLTGFCGTPALHSGMRRLPRASTKAF